MAYIIFLTRKKGKYEKIKLIKLELQAKRSRVSVLQYSGFEI